MIKDAGLEGVINELFISDISLYIEDMRRLTNIINKFILYDMKLGDFQCNYENLFSIILYKNLYPNDFAKLHKNKGLVYGFFSRKKELVRNITASLEKQFAAQSAELAELEQTFVTSIEKLCIIYLLAATEKFTESFNGVVSIAGSNKPLAQIKRSDEFFEAFKKRRILAMAAMFTRKETVGFLLLIWRRPLTQNFPTRSGKTGCPKTQKIIS